MYFSNRSVPLTIGQQCILLGANTSQAQLTSVTGYSGAIECGDVGLPAVLRLFMYRVKCQKALVNDSHLTPVSLPSDWHCVHAWVTALAHSRAWLDECRDAKYRTQNDPIHAFWRDDNELLDEDGHCLANLSICRVQLNGTVEWDVGVTFMAGSEYYKGRGILPRTALLSLAAALKAVLPSNAA